MYNPKHEYKMSYNDVLYAITNHIAMTIASYQTVKGLNSTKYTPHYYTK